MNNACIDRKRMDQIVPEYRSNYEDLTLFGINVVVDDVVTELYGVVDSETENTHDVDRDTELIKYLTQTNVSSSSQSMARTKQTARKMTSDGTLPATPVTTTGNNKSTPNPAFQSPGGQNLATFPRRSPRFLESDSELEEAAVMFGIGSPAESTRSQTPRQGRSPARGSPARGTPGRGIPARAPKNRPVGTVNPQVLPGTSTGGGTPARRSGQAGFVNRGRGGGAGRGASRSSPARFNLPSFSTEEDEDDDEETEEEMEVDFPNLNQQPQPQRRRPIAAKDINLIRAPRRGKSGFAEIARWNRSARQGVFNETWRGWMAK